MTTLTLRDLGFIGGLGGYDTDALTYIAAVEAADGQSLEGATKDAINAFVVGCKLDGIWNSAAQLLLHCGPRTLAGSLVPLKGVAPTNVGSNFTSSHYNRKSGLGKPSNTNAYLDSNVAVNSVGAVSHALFAYGNISETSGDKVLFGRFDGSSSASILDLLSWGNYAGGGRGFRSGSFTSGQFPISTSTAAATCMIGSRTSTTNATLYRDGASVTNTTNLTAALSSQNFYIYALNSNNTASFHSSSVLQATGIFSTGLDATQAAALRSATATYVAAIGAAF
jgi:hypothetical protein